MSQSLRHVFRVYKTTSTAPEVVHVMLCKHLVGEEKSHEKASLLIHTKLLDQHNAGGATQSVSFHIVEEWTTQPPFEPSV